MKFKRITAPEIESAYMKKNIEIRTDRLTIVPIGMDFFNSTHAYASDLETTRYMMFLPNYTEDETSEFLRASEEEWAKEYPEYYEFAVLLGDKHIGAVSLYRDEEDKNTGELGWIIHKDHQHKGYAYEAAKALMEYAAGKLGIRHIIAHCDTENLPSYRLMEKLGMKRTDEYGGRKNKCSDEERREYLYEVTYEKST